MAQIRARIEERSRRETAPTAQTARERAEAAPSESFAFDGNSIYRSSRGGGVGRVLYGTRRLLAPLVKFVFNIDPMVAALVVQARRNAQQAAFDDDVARRLAAREKQDAPSRRALQNLTAGMERLAADLKSHRKLLASMAERLDALEQTRTCEHGARPHGGGRADDDAPASPPAVHTPPPNR